MVDADENGQRSMVDVSKSVSQIEEYEMGREVWLMYRNG